ncbi:mycofactocin biosynthesis glycosyltransferase MftF [Rhodococcus aerolatus]
MTPRLPDGFAVALDPTTRRLDGGAALLGGSPPRLLRLAPAARALLTAAPLRVTDARTAGLARTLLDAGVAHPVAGTAPSPTPDRVTVVVPVRDNPTGVGRLLDALAGSGVARVVVVDDGSTPPLALPPHDLPTTVLRHDRSRGPAAARNTGTVAADTEWVAFLDSDVVPRPGWLELLLAHGADPALALVAPRVVAHELGRGWLARYESARSSLDLGPRAAPVVPLSRVAYVPSAALLVRRDAVGASPFDETMPVAEDVDLCWRLHAEGRRLRYEPAARVAHAHRTRARAWLGRKWFYGTGAAPLAGRHEGRVAPVVLAPWTAVAAPALLTATRPGVGAAGAVTVVAAVRLARSLTGLEHPYRAAATLGPQGLQGAVVQLASAALRPWWPLSAVAAVLSPRARRTLAVLAVAEGLLDWATHREPGRLELDPVRHVLAKRADDLAYGTGVWWGAWRARSPAALRPTVQRRRR